MADEKFITIRPRYELLHYKNIAGVVFSYGVADCNNLDEADFAKVLKYMRRCYGGRATTYGELQNEASGPTRPIPSVHRSIPKPGGSPKGADPVGSGDASAKTGNSGAATVGDGQERSETDKIVEAVELLDADDNEHWTAEGLPRVDAVAELSGLPGITRDSITIAAPDVVRPTQE